MRRIRSAVLLVATTGPGLGAIGLRMHSKFLSRTRAHC